MSKPSDGAVTRRSQATRTRLISVAEALFASRSIENVSLNEVSKAAGQKNSSACQYHFGDKQGLLQVILDRHVAGITAAREVLLNRLEESESPSGLRSLVNAFVQPIAAKLDDADGGRAFIRINAQLIALHTMSVHGTPASPLRLARSDRFVQALRQALRSTYLPETVARQRLLLAAVLVFHGLDDHVRMLETGSADRLESNTRLFIANLEDSITALLSAPISDATRELCISLEAEGDIVLPPSSTGPA